MLENNARRRIGRSFALTALIDFVLMCNVWKVLVPALGRIRTQKDAKRICSSRWAGVFIRWPSNDSVGDGWLLSTNRSSPSWVPLYGSYQRIRSSHFTCCTVMAKISWTAKRNEQDREKSGNDVQKVSMTVIDIKRTKRHLSRVMQVYK